MLAGDEGSPKFIQHITNNDSNIMEDDTKKGKLIQSNTLSLEKKNKKLLYENILSNEEINDFDEGKTSSLVRIQKNPIGSE